MGREAKHRDKIVRATAVLLRRRGYAATGVNEITELSGAPKGSLYHYFPGGKEQIAAEAITYAGGLVCKTIAELAQTSRSPAEAIRTYGQMLIGWMAQSDFADGCPLATTLLEVGPNEPAVVEAGRAAFASWIESFVGLLEHAGVPAAKARTPARSAIMMLEGALLLARIERNGTAIATASEEIAHLFDETVARTERAGSRAGKTKDSPPPRA
jgi:TetR/AcrR family transcriptional regulator, lmrAB and yxaGH operons repressor